MADGWRLDEGRFDHVAHEQVTNPLCVLPVSLVALLRLCVLGACQYNRTEFLEDVEDKNPVLAGRFHANFLAVILVKPES